MESYHSVAVRNAQQQANEDVGYSRGLVGALLQLPIPANVMRRGDGVDRACQGLCGAVLVGIHQRDQGFLTDLGWDWRWEEPRFNHRSTLRNRKCLRFYKHMILPSFPFSKNI